MSIEAIHLEISLNTKGKQYKCFPRTVCFHSQDLSPVLKTQESLLAGGGEEQTIC